MPLETVPLKPSGFPATITVAPCFGSSLLIFRNGTVDAKSALSKAMSPLLSKCLRIAAALFPLSVVTLILRAFFTT